MVKEESPDWGLARSENLRKGENPQRKSLENKKEDIDPQSTTVNHPNQNRFLEDQQEDPLGSEEDTGPVRINLQSAPQPFGGDESEHLINGGNADATPDHIHGTRGTDNPDNLIFGGTPKQVNQIDHEATHVSPAAFKAPAPNTKERSYSPQPSGRFSSSQTGRPAPENRSKPAGPLPVQYRETAPKPPRISPAIPAPPRKRKLGDVVGCLVRVGCFGFSFVALGLVCMLSVMFYQYYRIAATLPDIADLRQRASQFETTRIYDRNGNNLYEILDPNAGRRTYVPLSKISPYMVSATIATEDKGFYSHPGFDPLAIVRAFVQNYQGGEIVSGASTITQQLARNLLFTPEERSEQSYARKMREAILAAEITRRYSKDEILELYINEIYYGNLAYGVQAAAETYFGTTAANLDLAQSSFLAGLPQAPAVYDVYTNPEATLARQKDVLVLMFQLSNEQGCIYVSNSPERVCVDAVSVTKAAEEMQSMQFNSPEIKIRYPHWVNYIRSQLESKFDPQAIYRSGFNVYTTLDPDFQDFAQTAVSQQINTMKAQNAGSGALVAIHPNSGEILAMIGSADFYNEAISGQVNMAVSPRQPGSSIKPLTYLAAFEKGWTPATLIWDVPSQFPPSGLESDPNPPYEPVNYDGTFHGPVTVRAALANSYNIPAVKTLQYTGIYDDPSQPGEQGLIAMARKLGITTLTRPDYGLSLTLGGGEVTLLDLTAAYGVIANRGVRISPVSITKITDYQGNVVFEHRTQPGEQAIRPEHAYLITSILSDNQARSPAFGPNSVLKLPFPAAVKTGTTNDFRDNWTIGFTPNLVVGVWIGNPDYTPMRNTTGLSGAAPIWSNVMQSAAERFLDQGPKSFSPPPGVVDHVICSVSGTSPSQWCPRQTSEIFVFDQPPLRASDDLWQKATLDTWTGLRASPVCSDFIQDRLVLNVQDQFARKWIRRNPQGQAWASQMGFDPPVIFAPTRECEAGDPHPNINFAYPLDKDVIRDSPLDIYAIVNADNGFDFWQLSYGVGENPIEWEMLSQGKQAYNEPEVLYRWDLVGFPNQVITLRLYLKGENNAFAERKIRLFIDAPTPTPTPTETPLPTPTETPSPTPSEFPIPSETIPPAPTSEITQTPFFP